jgi:hypothetical protein
MTVFTRPNHPVRLAVLLLGTALAAGIIGSAIVAVDYIVRDQLESEVAGVQTGPGGDVAVPNGLTVVTPLADAGVYEDELGFEPMLPESFPDGTDPAPHFGATAPDARDRRFGHVRFAQKPDVATDGITGPTILIQQVRGDPGEGVDGELKRVRSGASRVLAATFDCGDLVVDVQFFFGPDAAPGEPFLTPYMTDTAQSVVDDLRGQC